MRFFRYLFICAVLLFSAVVYAELVDFSLPKDWGPLKPVLVSRVTQSKPKMKLSVKQAESLVSFLKTLSKSTPELLILQMSLPRTTVELLMAVHVRDLKLEEAEKMAKYLKELLEKFKFQNPAAFDENTSHIIGREWHEIDYTGENMTWQKQRLKYIPYGVLHFKSLECLTKFFVVESRLPYFRKIYRPQGE